MNGEHRKYPGRYLATVVDNRDPLGVQRLQVSCPSVYGEDPTGTVTSDWALPCGNIAEAVPFPGQLVWVSFQGDDPDYPIWEWGPKSVPKGLPNTSASFRGVAARPEVGETSTEMPATNFAPAPAELMTIPWGGHEIQLDRTPKAERIKIYHAKGAFIEIDPDGGIRIKSKGNVFDLSEGARTETTGLTKTETVKGSKVTSVKKLERHTNSSDLEHIVLGTASYTYGKSNIEVNGDHLYIVNGTETKEALGNFNHRVGGSYQMLANQLLKMTSLETIEFAALAANPLDLSTAKPGVRPIPGQRAAMGLKAIGAWSRLAADSVAGVPGSELLLDPLGMATELFSLINMNLFSPTILLAGPGGVPAALIRLLSAALTAVIAGPMTMTSVGVAQFGGSQTLLGVIPGAVAPVVTTASHPVDYITGAPILGSPSVFASIA